MILGIDLSHHKPKADLKKVKDAGYSFVILKATEGDSFIDREYSGYVKQCERIGMPVAAYHYYRDNDLMESQINLILKVVSKNVPIILDIEEGAGRNVNGWRVMINILKDHGYTVPLVYIPRWYWESIRSPSLEGFPPLWASHYVKGSGSGTDLFSRIPSSWWGGYGNNHIAMLQFTSKGMVPGCPPNVDVNCFVGSTQDLLDLFGKDTDDMEWPWNPATTELIPRAINDMYAAIARLDLNQDLYAKVSEIVKQQGEVVSRQEKIVENQERILAIMVGEGVELKGEGSIIVKAVRNGSVVSEDNGVADSTT